MWIVPKYNNLKWRLVFPTTTILQKHFGVIALDYFKMLAS